LSTLGVDSIFFADKGDVLVTGPSVIELSAYATDTWTRRLDLIHGTGTALGGTPDPQSSRFVACHWENGNVLVWDALTAKLIREVRTDMMFDPQHHIRLSNNGERFYIAKQPYHQKLDRVPSTLEEWNINTSTLRRILASYDRPITAMALSERAIAVSTGTRDVDLYDLATGQRRVFAGCHGEARQLAFNGDGTRLASICGDHSLYLWDADSGQLILKLSGHETAPLCLAFSADGQELASGDESGEVRIWNLKSRSLSLKIQAHDAPVSAVAFSPDSWILATSSRGGDGQSGEVRVWSAR
jgi:WD40 repeat protein